jgi:hypothetical protein
MRIFVAALEAAIDWRPYSREQDNIIGTLLQNIARDLVESCHLEFDP